METNQVAGNGQVMTDTLMLNTSNAGATVNNPSANFQANWTCNPNDLAIQQMHDLEATGWRGGDHIYDGPHDDFCFVCGSSMELFGCQTCENCYHAPCMTPSLDQENVPAFWFCPHCVQREFHIPPALPEEHHFAPLPTSLPFYPSRHSPIAVQQPSPNNPTSSEDRPSAAAQAQTRLSAPQRASNAPIGIDAAQPAKRSTEIHNAAKSRPRPSESTRFEARPSRGKSGRGRHSSPVRKKSKYSAFSLEVDKALAVLYSELETAAQCGKSDGKFQSKVEDLEQKLRVQEGQMMLTGRELEFAQKELAKERSDSSILKVDNFELLEQNLKLNEEVQKKENELKDWRKRLRTMMGNEVE